uniref:Methyltransferase domain-containing protein n=1 Tax=Hanusia phi TaxID=3032 RepID=A0A7S0HMX5_9CRYP|mmetsp:Transcript_28513/g.64671  ORF Transcript_28513/g.64671 Transcript_28513/m.64671 type:complete len:348 (+) Transcript_28513:64-1107(+)
MEATRACTKLQLLLMSEEEDPGEVQVEIQDQPSAQAQASDDYFHSYSDLSVHELMLRDQPRLTAYSDCIEKNAHLFQSKVVLDVGCGTGILSLFAARAGARKVYAVEASEMHKKAETLIKENGYSDTIEIIHDVVENVKLPEKVDVIISEWMGFYLLHESMLASVIDARERLLKEGGIVIPSTGKIYICPVAMEHFRKQHVDYWKAYHGFDFSSIGDEIMTAKMSTPFVEQISSSELLSRPQEFTNIDFNKVETAELVSLTGDFSFEVERTAQMAGFAFWFDCDFTLESSFPIILDTSPSSEPTHWKQTTVFLGVFADVQKGEQVEVKVTMQQDDMNPRHYSISIQS